MSQPVYYGETTVTSSAWTRVSFGFFNLYLIIVIPDRDNTDDLLISFDAVNTHGSLLPGEPLNLTDKKNNHIYLMAASGTQVARVWAY